MTDKQIIIDGVDVSGCICYKATGKYNTCGYNCERKHNCYYKQLKRKEQECEFSNLRIIQLQETLSQYETDLSTKDCIVETCKAQYKELEAELKSSKELRKYTYDCCKRAGEELAKNSFDWDGKEKNLVVQAIELNERFDQLKAENEQLKTKVFRFESKQTSMGKQNKELIENNLNLSKENAKIKAENDYFKHKIFRYEEIFKHSVDIINNPVTATEVEIFHSGVKALGKSLIAEENNKLHKTLTEIKEIVTCPRKIEATFNINNWIEIRNNILQKISEVEDE